MEVILTFIVALVVISASVPLSNFSLNDHWKTFKKNYEKEYDKHEEESQRRLNWEKNIYLIDDHNRKADQGIYTYWLGINEYADMTNAEFAALMSYTSPPKGTHRNSTITSQNMRFDSLPNEVDWREKGYVTEVKNQGTCGGCWAFAATGALEGQHFKNTGKLVSLSEQELIDCCEENGCSGGFMNDAFMCIRDIGGIELEENYDYEGNNGVCRFNISRIAAQVSDFTTIETSCEDCLQYAVATVGPISTAIYSKEDTFHLYKSGVYQSNNCTHKLSHAVLVVGYGSEDGQDYWLVKNSWGSTWGLDGYFKLARNSKNMCGIATMASFPSE